MYCLSERVTQLWAQRVMRMAYRSMFRRIPPPKYVGKRHRNMIHSATPWVRYERRWIYFIKFVICYSKPVHMRIIFRSFFLHRANNYKGLTEKVSMSPVTSCHSWQCMYHSPGTHAVDLREKLPDDHEKRASHHRKSSYFIAQRA